MPFSNTCRWKWWRSLAAHDNEWWLACFSFRVWPLKWYAPECIYESKFTSKGDVWSFGVCSWEILSHGKKPYAEFSHGHEVVAYAIEGRGRLAIPDGCPESVYVEKAPPLTLHPRYLLIETWMWSRHPCPRPLVSVLQQATSHTFFFVFFFLGGGRGMLTWVRSHLMSLSFRYAILLNCWRHERGERPEFEKLAAQLHAIDLGACAPDYETPSAPPPARPPRSGKWWYTRFSRLCHFSMTFFSLFCRLIDKNEELFFLGESIFVIFWLCYGCTDL